jgi:hypothetical protein
MPDAFLATTAVLIPGGEDGDDTVNILTPVTDEARL